ncbi:MAG: hypothetical protein K2Y32_17165 [Candidatus Obscuribacterales bacterium]|nr:hypothetical protein [Candidatus Obscuribacterales bacterium]
MISLEHNELVISFPEVHKLARVGLNFQRTLRIPDNDQVYPLPPGLGSFPMVHVDDYKNTIPANWIEHGGVVLPMYQSEAMWICFNPRSAPGRASAYPFAIKISTGKIDAITGEELKKGLHRNKQDYVVVPGQPWLDGYCVKKGVIRQFVAMPLGQGYSAEEQITKKAEFGGIQIVVYPLKAEVYERLYPEGSIDQLRARLGSNPDDSPWNWGASSKGAKSGWGSASPYLDIAGAAYPPAPGGSGGFESTGAWGASPAASPVPAQASAMKAAKAFAAPDMGIAPGGRMKQEIYKDTFSLDDWDIENGSRCFIHLANSLAWKNITGAVPPHEPPSANVYACYGLPWYDYYDGDLDALSGSGKLANLKSVQELSQKKGEPIDNKPLKKLPVVNQPQKPVREGDF